MDFFKPSHYPSDWHLHRDGERYLTEISRRCAEVPAPGQADIALFKFGRVFSHGAIVTSWPSVIHSLINCGVGYGSAEEAPLAGREVSFWSPF